MKVTPNNIKNLKANEVFTYGSNCAGIHGAGAARQALKWGAKMGKDGFSGQTYGISTKDHNIQTLPLSEIQKNIKKFLDFAKSRPELEFLCTAVGCGLAGYTNKDIAPLFLEFPIPDNVALPADFWQWDSDSDGMS